MNSLSRRRLLQSLGVSALAFAMPSLARSCDGAPPEADAFNLWNDRFRRNAESLAYRKISPLQWQEVMDQLYGDAPLAELKQLLTFDQLRQRILEKMPADRHEFFQTVHLNLNQVAQCQFAG